MLVPISGMVNLASVELSGKPLQEIQQIACSVKVWYTTIARILRIVV